MILAAIILIVLIAIISWYNLGMDNPPVKVSPKDVFLHLLAIVALYASAVSFIVLIFQYINLALPDALQSGYYDIESAHSAIRLSISTLIVVFPTYVVVSWILGKGYAIDPQKRNLRIRKWLIYFTLFITGLVAIGDLVTLVYNFLGGDLTSQFVLKILTVLFVTGSIFFYYFIDVRKYKTE